MPIESQVVALLITQSPRIVVLMIGTIVGSLRGDSGAGKMRQNRKVFESMQRQ